MRILDWNETMREDESIYLSFRTTGHDGPHNQPTRGPEFDEMM